MKVMLFSGTSEGRILAEFCQKKHIEVQVHVATEYGKKVMGEFPAAVGRMGCEEMVREMKAYCPDYVVDATHPYAVEVTKNIRRACKEEGLFYIRLFRKPEDIAMQDKKGIITVSSIKEAADYLNDTKGNILVATGSKELAAYTGLDDYRNRIYLRALPTKEVKKQCREFGIAEEHLILEQGPFSMEQNRLHIKRCKAAYLVTKESGKAGGFSDKIEAAKSENTTVIVVSRPVKEKGHSLSEVMQILEKKMKKVTIIGCGPGAEETMTKQAESYIEQAEALIGAARLTEPYKGKKECFSCYEKEEIKNYIDASEKENFAVLMSGDSGFYSGTHSLLELLQEDYSVKVIPGISSLSYMASKIGRAWEDVSILSVHGRDANVTETVRRNRETFLLTGGNAASICKELTAAGYGNLTVYIGERLSYPEENIMKLRIEEAQHKDFDKLTVLWIVNEKKNAFYHIGIEDKYFIRGSVPMTKSEVRAISLSKLCLAREAVAWDIGCGTGSVTVEMALCADKGKIFAVDKNEEAVELTRQNIKKFGIENVSVIQAGAAEAIGQLPAPDAVFIGGSKGELGPVIKEAVKKNPGVRIVCNMIVLENITEVLQLLESCNLDDVEIVQAAISYSAKAGDAHMMVGQNPIYIISAGGC